MYRRLVILPLALAIALSGCGDSAETAQEPASAKTGRDAASSSTPTKRPTPAPATADASAKVACRHWRNVVGDISKGILSDEEIRTKVQEVYDSAWVSEEPGIAEGAEAVLRAVTMDDGEAFLAAMGDFTDACVAANAFA
jgi:hypothetical protein